jgi:hypothetical protein
VARFVFENLKRGSREKILDCGGKRSATPLSERRKAFTNSIHPSASESAVAAALCQRNPKAAACTE